MGVVISFINLKGGVGKTTCCANIAGEFARENRKVLVIDGDPQANLSTLLMNPERYSKKFDYERKDDEVYKDTIYQIFLDAMVEDESKKKFDPATAIIKSVVRQTVQNKETQPLPHLDLLPSSYHLMQLEQKIVNYVRSRFAILDRFVEKIKKDYDFIIIDCPPNIYTTTHNSLYASDFYIIPTIPDYLSVSGMPLLVNNLIKTIEIKKEERNASVELAGILINLRDKRITIHKEGVLRIERMLTYFKEHKLVSENSVVFQNQITNKVDISNSSGNYLPVCVDKPRSESTMEIRNVCHEILDRISKK